MQREYTLKDLAPIELQKFIYNLSDINYVIFCSCCEHIRKNITTNAFYVLVNYISQPSLCTQVSELLLPENPEWNRLTETEQKDTVLSLQFALSDISGICFSDNKTSYYLGMNHLCCYDYYDFIRSLDTLEFELYQDCISLVKHRALVFWKDLCDVYECLSCLSDLSALSCDGNGTDICETLGKKLINFLLKQM